MIRTLQGRQKRLALRNDYRVESAIILCFPERLTGKVAILQMYLKQKTLWSRTGVSCWTLRNVNPWSQVFSSAVFFGGAELDIGRLRCMFQAKEQQNPSIKEKAALRVFFCPKWDLKEKHRGIVKIFGTVKKLLSRWKHLEMFQHHMENMAPRSNNNYILTYVSASF